MEPTVTDKTLTKRSMGIKTACKSTKISKNTLQITPKIIILGAEAKSRVTLVIDQS
jgi:hypothetical protein